MQTNKPTYTLTYMRTCMQACTLAHRDTHTHAHGPSGHISALRQPSITSPTALDPRRVPSNTHKDVENMLGLGRTDCRGPELQVWTDLRFFVVVGPWGCVFGVYSVLHKVDTPKVSEEPHSLQSP